MAKAQTITVAGAGALGLTTALALADAGARVTVFDPAAPLANASGVAAGMLAPAFESVLDDTAAPHLDLLLGARDLWPALEARIGIAIDRAGAAAVGGEGFLARVDAGLRRQGLPPTELGQKTLQGLAPGLDPAWARGVLTREDWRIDAAEAIAALRRACEAAGVAFRDRAAAGFEGAERLVIATGGGHDLAVVAPELTHLAPIKGHILRARAAPYEGVVVRGEGAYVTAAPDGLTVGATMQAGVADPQVVEAEAEPLRTAGARLFPALAQAPTRAFAGVRAATPDGLPMVGRGRHNGVLLAVGARRNGWLLAPLAAKVIAACVTEGEAGPFAAKLDPARFG
jgi:glycine oxidase